VFFVYLIAFPIWAAMLVWLFEPQRQQDKADAPAAAATPFPWHRALAVVAVTFSASLLYYVFIINGSLVFAEVGVNQPQRYAELIFIPQLFILAGAGLFRLLAGRGHALQLGVFLALMGTGLAGMGLAGDAPSMALALIVQQMAAGMAVPTLIAWTQTKFDFAHRGRGMGLWTGAFFLGQSQSPRLVHLLEGQAGSMRNAFLVAGLCGVAGGLVALLIATRRRSAA
jgi:hypothetical protein